MHKQGFIIKMSILSVIHRHDNGNHNDTRFIDFNANFPKPYGDKALQRHVVESILINELHMAKAVNSKTKWNTIAIL